MSLVDLRLISVKGGSPLEDTALRLKNITKTYSGVIALDNVSFDLKKGEVHALVGENGAGKSTLVKIISGAEEADSGTIEIDGHAFTRITPKISKENGISVIYQEFNLIDGLTVAENIFLGETFGTLVNFKLLRQKTMDIFKKMDISIDPTGLVRTLPSAQQQLVEIAKSVSTKAKIIIMDEPTAPLTVSEVDKLFGIIHKLKTTGASIIYISHRLEEIFEICDRVTVLRDGCYVDTKDIKNTDRKHLISMMVGRELRESYPLRHHIAEEKVLELQNVTGNGDRNISFYLRKGEILGLAGLVGAGRTELARMVFGADKKDSGKILVNGKEVKIKSPQDAIKNKIGLIPEDRRRQGCFLIKGVDWNISIANLKHISRFGVINRKCEIEQTEYYHNRLNIKSAALDQHVNHLSGGNQQKVVVAKTLATDSDIIIFDEPTRGIDVGAKNEIYNLMTELADEGKSIIMISSDMEELIGMSDRILVLCEGRLAGQMSRREFAQDAILELASGH